MDTVDTTTRSRIMSSVRHKNTKPEMLLRSALHRSGMRYRLHVKGLPGTPDLVFPRYRSAIFVHGCYWHLHGCYRSTSPKSRREFWEQKFHTNRDRDSRNRSDLKERGWRVLVVWECSLLGKHALQLNEITAIVRCWLEGAHEESEIVGRPLHLQSGLDSY